eukprot:scaffold96726_cov41-Prasinocladus_malaysianus.AAC.2
MVCSFLPTICMYIQEQAAGADNHDDHDGAYYTSKGEHDLRLQGRQPSPRKASQQQQQPAAAEASASLSARQAMDDGVRPRRLADHNNDSPRAAHWMPPIVKVRNARRLDITTSRCAWTTSPVDVTDIPSSSWTETSSLRIGFRYDK